MAAVAPVGACSGAMQALPPECSAKFRPLRRLGAGGHGEVWEAEQVSLGRRVAVKVCLSIDDPEAVKRFATEARISASLAHPNIVQVIDHGVEGAPWIAFELVEGRSLRERLEAGALPPLEALDAIVQVAGALEAAHASGVLHRDVKPDNLIAGADGRVQVADFGIATWGGAKSVKTRTGVIMGTPAYIAPEQVLGERATAASDVYALGVTAFELFTGAPPFAGATFVDLLDAHVQSPVPKASARRRGLSPELDRVLERALAKKPADRWKSAGEFAAALGALRGALARTRAGAVATVEVMAPTAKAHRATRVAPPPGARRSPALAVAAAAFALVIFTAWRPRPAVSPASPTATPAAAPGAALDILRDELLSIADRTNLSRQGPWHLTRPISGFFSEVERVRERYKATVADEDRLVFLAPAAQLAINASMLMNTRELARNAQAELAMGQWQAEHTGAPAGSVQALVDHLTSTMLDELRRERTLVWHLRLKWMLEAFDALVARFAGRPPGRAELVACIDLFQVVAYQLNDATWIEWSDPVNAAARPAHVERTTNLLTRVLVPALRDLRAPEREALPHLDRLLAGACDLANAPDAPASHLGAARAGLRAIAEMMARSERWRPALAQSTSLAFQQGRPLASTLGWLLLDNGPATLDETVVLALARDWAQEMHEQEAAAPPRGFAELAKRGERLAPLVLGPADPGALLRLYLGTRSAIRVGQRISDLGPARRLRAELARGPAGAGRWIELLVQAELADTVNDDATRVHAARDAVAAFGEPLVPGEPSWAASWIAYLIVQGELAKALKDASHREDSCALLARVRARLPRLHHVLRHVELKAQVVELLRWRAKRCGVADPYLELIRSL